MNTTGENLRGVSGIYCAIHRASGRCYVGSTINLAVRRSAHEGSAMRGSGAKFHRALAEYGTDSFDFEVLERCHKSHLLEREKFYICLLDACGVNGLNVQSEPNAVYGIIPNAATRERQSIAKRGSKLSDEHRAKLRGKRGKKLPFTDEHKAKLSAAAKRRTPEDRARHTAHLIGKKQSPEWIAKRFVKIIGSKRTPEQRDKISASLKGRKTTPEHRARMSAGWAARKARIEAQSAQTLLDVIQASR